MKHIIFDVDGTLWDSTESVAASWNLVLREHSRLDLLITAEILNNLFGKTMTEIADAIFPSLPSDERIRLMELCLSYENRYLEEHPGTLYEGVKETLQALSERCRLYIVSNCQSGYIEVLLQTCGLSRYITDYLCFGDTQAPKNETIRTLMKRNQITDAVYVGDTQADADACSKAGVPFIFASYGFGDVPDAKVRIRSISELTSLV